METKQEQEEVPTSFTDWREARRFRAWELHAQGWSQARIAEALGVTRGAVSQWLKSVREKGLSALLSSTSKRGAQSRLTPANLEQLPKYLERGAEAYGFRGALWTRGRVRDVIKQEFGITYSERHVGRILHQINWTLQKPVERAEQRDEEALAAWHTETFPDLKKRPRRKNAP